MQELLFLSHRIPYPPNKGDKIRSYHLLKHLSRQFRVHLGTFIDTDEDWQYMHSVQNLCDKTCFVKLDPKIARIQCLQGLFSNRPLTLPFYWNRQLSRWVDKVLQVRPIQKIVIYSAAMTQYVRHIHYAQRLIDFVDIDSDKWQQYAKKKKWPMSWIYQREARLLQAYERQIALEFDKATFVSKKESELFKQLLSSDFDKVDYFNNGVDVDYFSPLKAFDNPYSSSGKPVLVFTGAMDYWANVDAVVWFAQAVFPIVRSQIPDIQFCIVGSKPTEQVQILKKIPGITVTGSVDDIRPYLKYASVAVAPLRIARGIQNKVLEAMAMEKLVVVSPQALEGIQAIPEKEVFVANGEREFADQIIEVLAKYNKGTHQAAARMRILNDYSWPVSLARIDQIWDKLNEVKAA